MNRSLLLALAWLALPLTALAQTTPTKKPLPPLRVEQPIQYKKTGRSGPQDRAVTIGPDGMLNTTTQDSAKSMYGYGTGTGTGGDGILLPPASFNIVASATQLSLTWSQVEGATYRLEYAFAPDGPWTLLDASANTFYTHAALTPGLPVFYRLKSIRGGESGWTATKAARTAGSPALAITDTVTSASACTAGFRVTGGFPGAPLQWSVNGSPFQPVASSSVSYQAATGTQNLVVRYAHNPDFQATRALPLTCATGTSTPVAVGPISFSEASGGRPSFTWGNANTTSSADGLVIERSFDLNDWSRAELIAQVSATATGHTFSAKPAYAHYTQYLRVTPRKGAISAAPRYLEYRVAGPCGLTHSIGIDETNCKLSVYPGNVPAGLGTVITVNGMDYGIYQSKPITPGSYTISVSAPGTPGCATSSLSYAIACDNPSQVTYLPQRQIAPQSLSVTKPNPNTLVFRWSRAALVEGFRDYQLYILKKSGVNWEWLYGRLVGASATAGTEGNRSDTTFTFSNLLPDTEYRLQVQPRSLSSDVSLWGALSQLDTRTSGGVVIAAATAPSGLQKTDSTQTSASFSWSGSPTGHNGFILSWYSAGDVFINQQEIEGADTRVATIAGLTSGTGYRADLRSRSQYGADKHSPPTARIAFRTANPSAPVVSADTGQYAQYHDAVVMSEMGFRGADYNYAMPQKNVYYDLKTSTEKAVKFDIEFAGEDGRLMTDRAWNANASGLILDVWNGGGSVPSSQADLSVDWAGATLVFNSNLKYSRVNLPFGFLNKPAGTNTIRVERNNYRKKNPDGSDRWEQVFISDGNATGFVLDGSTPQRTMYVREIESFPADSTIWRFRVTYTYNNFSQSLTSREYMVSTIPGEEWRKKDGSWPPNWKVLAWKYWSIDNGPPQQGPLQNVDLKNFTFDGTPGCNLMDGEDHSIMIYWSHKADGTEPRNPTYFTLHTKRDPAAYP